MVKRINVAFSNEEHLLLVEKKEKLRQKLGIPRLSWEKFILKLI